ncbi:uncharacterized protein MELLADRAFT_59219 [Melampsora larici-populina 98AG31]|uniref:F-box domain-containing protein n=1 Tax=Melampsora larici-populina (strain 98AG31 / pathotype 3-4-7) TaxID=747676 RepID=F4R5H4_MELLP|nr:uncharacterized protein MELLADRAFT_59219 [Melampsora larici-populina 98AG31]EGG12048.1 hypothetical protein MELLADRAFT_59219 [Melampsora larici-populina 98AG31]
MSTSNKLPIEIVECIISQLYQTMPCIAGVASNSADKSFLEHTSIIDLLKLRLVNKVWAMAVQPVIYRSLFLRTPWVEGYFMKMWQTSYGFSPFSNLRRLYLYQLIFRHPGIEGQALWDLSEDCSRQHEYGCVVRGSSWIPMHDASDIIILCGRNLEELKFNFAGSVGFSDSLVIAMKQIKKLTTLIIEGTNVRYIGNNHQSLIAVLNNATKLELLSLRLLDLESLEVDAGALPNLIHLWVTAHPYNLPAINSFCNSEGRAIRLLEFSPSFYRREAPEMILASKNTLEGLFVNTIPHLIPEGLRFTSFPKLRLIRTGTFARSEPPAWLKWPFFRNIEILVINYRGTKSHWHIELEQIGGFASRNKLNLKHMVFTTPSRKDHSDPRLEKFFQDCGIQCHFEHRLDHTGLLVRERCAQSGATVLNVFDCQP